MIVAALAVAAAIAAMRNSSKQKPVGVMTISHDGLVALIKREGKKNKAYLDVRGIKTIGVGHTGNDFKMGDVWTDEKILAVLDKDCDIAEKAVNDAMSKYGFSLNQQQFDALVSFIFNIGTGGFRKSQTLQHLAARDYKKAGNGMMGWIKPIEIKSRRESEVKQFFS